MTYREKLEKYKRDELEAAEKQQIYDDIEKQKAISDYIFDEESDITDIDFPDEKEMSEKEDNIEKEIKKSIRRAFLKFGVITLAAATVIVLFVVFLLPEIISGLYYNPGKEAGEYTNQMSFDYAVYSEMNLPGYYRDSVSVNDRGYGNYDISINQIVSFDDRFNNVAGKVEKNSLTLYDTNTLCKPTGNAFGWFQADLTRGTKLTDQNEEDSVSAYGTPELSRSYLKELRSNQIYIGYVTLNEMMPYSDFIRYYNRLSDKYPISNGWCAVVSSNIDKDAFHPDNIGMNCQYPSGTSLLNNDKIEDYPELIFWADQKTKFTTKIKKKNSEKIMEKHFISMAEYLADQKDFLKLMDEEETKYREASEYVKKNGLTIYGFAVTADKDTLLSILDDKEVHGILTRGV